MRSHRNPRRPLGIGVQLPEVERVVRWPEMHAMALGAEAAGFDSLWLGDHLLYRDAGNPARGPWEAWSMLAALAAVTTSLRLGPLVAATSFHNPAMLAKKAAAVDEVSNGRLIVGLGAGWNETEYRAFGFPYDHRVSRFEEAFTIIRKLLARESVSFAGHYYRTQDCELLPARSGPGGPPLMIGSMGPRMLAITLPWVQAWNAWYAWFGNTVEGFRPLLAKLDAACVTAGRDPRTLSRTVAVLVQAPGGQGRLRGDEERSGAPPITGAPAQIADTLRRFADTGVDHVQLVLDPITCESIRWCGDIVTALDSG